MAYNLYAYCGNNPVSNLDKFGNFFKSIAKKVLNTMHIAKKNIAIKRAVKKVSKTVKKITKSISENSEIVGDYTNELISLMFRNGGQIFQLTRVFDGFVAFGAFFDNSTESGAWNYRNSDNWENDLGLPFPGDKEFLLCGRTITVEDFGNINYGFVGASMGISPTILYMGGGYAKIGFSLKLLKILEKPYYGDDPNDHEAVKFGIYLFNNGGYC